MNKEKASSKSSVGFLGAAIKSWLTVTLVLVMLSGLCGTVAAAEAQKDDGWRFAVTPYLWYAGFSADMRYSGSGGNPNIEVSQETSSKELNMAFMLGAEASKGPLSILTDVVYLDLDSESSSVTSVDFPATGEVDASADTGTETTLKGVLWSLALGGSIGKSDAFEMGGLFGFRYLGVEAETDWELESDVTDPGTGGTFGRTGSVSGRDDVWDLIMGLRGRVNLGKTGLYIPYYVDIGTWTSYLTCQGVLGLGWDFASWGEVMLDYRYLYYEFYSGQMLENLVVQGPALGLRFKF